jgi:Putative tRNA binding domain
MSVIAMKITKAEKHPNADRLRLYEAQTPTQTVVFVANLTNVYEVDDVVAVAQVGTVLVLDGEALEIVPTTIRKVESHGMGLGKTVHPVGCNLDSQFPWPFDTRVRTQDVGLSTSGWIPEAVASRKFGVSGRILMHRDGHGLTYSIVHDDDGSIGHYVPAELKII